MESEKKAKELFSSVSYLYTPHHDAKNSALAICDEVINELRKLVDSDSYYTSQRFEFWKEVREQINKL